MSKRRASEPLGAIRDLKLKNIYFSFIKSIFSVEILNLALLAHCGRGGGVAGVQRSHSLGDIFTAQKPFVCLKETLCSLLTSNMLDSSWHKEMVTGALKVIFSLDKTC